MEIQIGELLTVNHYAAEKHIKGIVVKHNKDKLVLGLDREFDEIEVVKGDPVVLGFKKDNIVYILGSEIKNINYKKRLIEAKINNVIYEGNDQRKEDRFPVSLYGDMSVGSNRKKHFITIKDISTSGMMINSEEEFNVNEEFALNVCIDNTTLDLAGEIVRKNKTPNNYEYGLLFSKKSKESVPYMNEYIQKIKKNEEQSIEDLKNKFKV